MKYEIYADMSASPDFERFDFVSAGKFGNIHKRISFVPIVSTRVYNLAFGDISEHGEVDYHSVSDNGDRNKILATLAKAVELYTLKYPERWIYFAGSTKERTRLYRMAIGLNLEWLSEIFEIYAVTDDNTTVIPFQKNMKITAFLIKRKNV